MKGPNARFSCRTLLRMVVVAAMALSTAAHAESRVDSAIEAAYPHGLTQAGAESLLEKSDVRALTVRLFDPAERYRDNVVAFLGFLGGSDTVEDLLALLAADAIGPSLPENDRARLQVPIALANMARRGISGANDALATLATSPQQRDRHDAGMAEQLSFALRRAAEPLSNNEKVDDDTDAAPVAIVPRTLDNQARLHEIGLTFANHPAVNDPISDERVDTMLESGSFLTRNEDSASDIGCCIHFARSGSAGVFGAGGDGLDVISSEAELDAVLDAPGPRFKVVRAINWCGGPGTNFSGCARQRGHGAAVVRLSDPNFEAGLWLHEYGHNADLNHVGDVRNFMSATGGYDCGPFSLCPDDTLTQAQCDAFHNPPGATGGSTTDIGACQGIACGNGFVDPFETCDDGNASNNDACTNECENAICGDGFEYTGVEDCDDGNASNEDACLNGCTDATCGDTFVHNGIEDCDDGNASNTDDCLNDCSAATCGDGFLWADVESCDDQNSDGGDGCSASCRVEPCNTCSMQPSSCNPLANGTQCDDGNGLTSNDICATGACSGQGLQLDAFTVYKIKASRGTPKPRKFGPVVLTDALHTTKYVISPGKGLGLPTSLGSNVNDLNTHLEEYKIKRTRGEPKFARVRYFRILDECNQTLVRVDTPVSLMVPTHMDEANPTAQPNPANHNVDHYLCYNAKQDGRAPAGGSYPRFPKRVQVDGANSFETRRYDLKKLQKICLPVAMVEDPNDPSVIQSGPDRGTPRPVAGVGVTSANRILTCYKSGLSKSVSPQDGCGPIDPTDSGESITPRQEKHSKRSNVHLANAFGVEEVDTKKQVEICLPSAASPCGNDVTEPGEQCDGADDGACPGQCTSACTCGPVEDIDPCAAGIVDRWEFPVTLGEDVTVRADTTAPASASDLVIRVTCPVLAIDESRDDELPCTHQPPRGFCPDLGFHAAGSDTCTVRVSTNGDKSCEGISQAGYSLVVTRSGVPETPVLVGDDEVVP